MRVAAIMPCRGRPEQTIANVKRLLATAGYDDWELACVVNDEHPPASFTGPLSDLSRLYVTGKRLTYWQSLELATRHADAPLLVNLANDLIPGQHWLRRAIAAYQQTFGDGDGMIGFNGDSHEVGHSCHFLIARGLLEGYGGWPVWYDHNFGDTELCQRAIADRRYAKAPWALLFHDHPYFGGADDQVYAEGRAQADKDERLYLERKRAGWPTPA